MAWPIEEKMAHAAVKFIQYYLHFQGQVYLAFSGGKDSQTLNWIIREIFNGRWKKYIEFEIFVFCNENGLNYDEINYHTIIENKIWGLPPRVFCDTGLEFPELRKHVKTFPGTVWIRPKRKFPDVIKNIGVAVGSKQIAMQLRRLKEYTKNPSKKNAATRKLYETGIRRDGKKSKHLGLSPFWKRMLNSPFNVSDQCCDIFKKEPWDRYERETGRKGISGSTVYESSVRRMSYMQTGCNTFEKGKELCRPISIFSEEDIWQIAQENAITFCSVYYDREVKVPDGSGGDFVITLPGEKRTGCMFCLFGIHKESKKSLNRIQRMALTHPKQYEFMINVCGLGIVLGFIGVEYQVSIELLRKLKMINL